VIYLFAYMRAAGKRSLGFTLSALAMTGLLLIGLQGIVRQLLG
jgi:hypothetical protein